MQQGMASLCCLEYKIFGMFHEIFLHRIYPGASPKQTTLSESLHDTQLKYLAIISDHHCSLVLQRDY